MTHPPTTDSPPAARYSTRQTASNDKRRPPAKVDRLKCRADQDTDATTETGRKSLNSLTHSRSNNRAN